MEGLTSLSLAGELKSEDSDLYVQYFLSDISVHQLVVFNVTFPDCYTVEGVMYKLSHCTLRS